MFMKIIHIMAVGVTKVSYDKVSFDSRQVEQFVIKSNGSWI